MHEGEIVVTAAWASQLVRAQFPHWDGLPLRPLPTGGSDNVMIRLGENLVLRFPRVARAVASLEVEARWLGWLAGAVPVQVPEVVERGAPGDGYPFPWLVLRWIAGEDALRAPVQDKLAAAQVLAGLVGSLQSLPVPGGAPRKGEGQQLRSRDAFLREMVARITDEADPAQVLRQWEAALALPTWEGPPVLVHADLHPLNLLTREGSLTAVIDWSGFGAGDPALDLICGWTVLGRTSRELFRQSLDVDDTTWARGHALAFSKAVMAVPYYRTSNPPLRDVMLRTLNQCLEDAPG